MKKSLLTVCLFLTVSNIAVYAASSPLPQITQGSLANGLKYTLVPLTGQQQRIDIRLLVGVGSLNENDDQLGVAHMLEHMVFHRSEGFPNGVAQTLHQQGWARGKNYNAVTNHERTMYMLSPPKGSHQTEQSLNVLSQMVGHTNFTVQDLEKERPIILEEWRGKLGVAERMNQQRMQALRADSRYPTRPVIGTEDSIRNTAVTKIKQFHDTWYQPQNMQLMLIGDVDPKRVIPQIEQYFGSIPSKALPLSENYDPQLMKQLRIVQLYDSESGSSQISYVYRLDDSLSKQDSKEGMRQRLVDQIATTVLTQQVKRQAEQLPSQTASMVMRKADIGQHTTAVGFFVEVLPDQHDAALPILLEEISRLQRYPLAVEDIEQAKAEITATAERMLKKTEQREFEEWVQKLTLSLQQKRDYSGSWIVAQNALKIIPTIRSEEINQRIQTWLTAPDQVLQYSVPGNAEFKLPSEIEVRELESEIAQQSLQPLQKNIQAVLPHLPTIKKQGKIKAVQAIDKNQVEEWTLSNGDRVIWLKTPLAKDKIYFTAQSSAGFMAEGINPWQAQIASQIIAQTGPQGWEASDLTAWKKQHGISLNISQNADELMITGQSSEKEFAQFLHLYNAIQQSPKLESQALKNTLATLMRRKAHTASSVSGLRENETKQLRFDPQQDTQPTLDELQHVKSSDLEKQWEQSVQAPVTYYVLANIPAKKMKADIAKSLAGLLRQQPFKINSVQAKTGNRQKISAINIEPRAEIRAWSFNPVTWSPEEAVKVSIARNLAEKYLKNTLRDQEQGIYRMRVDSTLNDKNERIETEISYTASPDRVNELWQKTQHTLQQLPQLIQEEDVVQQRQNFERNEKARTLDIQTLQKRLLLSYQHYGDARYLSSMQNLSTVITTAEIREMAAKLINTDNQVLYITLPNPEISAK